MVFYYFLFLSLVRLLLKRRVVREFCTQLQLSASFSYVNFFQLNLVGLWRDSNVFKRLLLSFYFQQFRKSLLIETQDTQH